MEDNATLIELLLQRVTEYGKTSYELAKLKALDKISDIASGLIVNSIVFVLFASFMIFLNLGLALWLGEILGKNYYGFGVVSAFYIVLAVFVHFFINKCNKRFYI